MTAPRKDIGFHSFRLERSQHRLYEGTRVVALRPKTWDVLCHLIDRPGQLVSKDEILDAVWGEVAVTEHMVQISINELRKALGDDARHPRFIETQHRRGFRWIAPLHAPTASVESDEAGEPMVGRDAELATLERHWGNALAGQRRTVFLSGEAGIGKTTLAQAFLRSISRPGSPEAWIGRGQCVAQSGRSEAFLPVLEALTALCERGDMVALLRRHAPAWLVQMPGVVAESERLSLHRASAGVAAEQSLRMLAEALEAASRERPLVLLLEDLHWADLGTTDLIALLAQRTTEARLLLLGTYRPVDAIVADHPIRPRIHELRARGLTFDVALPLLNSAAVEALIERHFPGAPFHDELARWIQSHTGGQPLFLSHLFADLLQRGALIHDDDGWRRVSPLDTQPVPTSTQLLLRQRLEALEETDRRLLLGASVVGLEASAAAVAAALGDDVLEVDRRGTQLAARGDFLRPSESIAAPGETPSSQFTFVHALHREVIYQGIGRAERAHMHRRVAEWLEQVHHGETHRVAERLATHYELAGEVSHAVEHLRLAATRSIERSAPSTAVELLDRALHLLASQPTSRDDSLETLLRIELARALREAKGANHPDVDGAFERAYAFTEGTAESPMKVLALIGCAYLHFARARFVKAEELCREAVGVAERLGIPIVSAYAEGGLAAVLRRTGGLLEAKSLFERALAVEGEIGREMRPDVRTASMSAFSQTLFLLGEAERAQAVSQQAIERATASGFAYDQVWARHNAAELAMYLDEPKAAQRHASLVIHLADTHGFPFWSTIARGIQGWAHLRERQDMAGLEAARRGAEACRSYGLAMQYSVSLLHLANCLLLAERFDDCSEALLEALQLVESNGDRMVEPELWRLRAEVLVRTSNPDHDLAIAYLDRALASARAQGARWWEERALASRAKLDIHGPGPSP